METKRKKRYRPIISVFIAVLLTGLIIRVFVLDTFTVAGNSMAPTFQEGDYLFVNKLAYRASKPSRSDVVVFNFRQHASLNAVKRILGLPGEWIHIKNGTVYVKNDKKEESILSMQLYSAEYVNESATSSLYRLDPYEYYLIGDNALLSVDSRDLGPVDLYKIQGKVIGAWRMSSFEWLSTDTKSSRRLNK